MHIMLCDDDETFLEEINAKIYMLSKKNDIVIEVEKFTSSEEMMNIVRHTISDLNLAFFIDIDMPQIDGFEVAIQLRKMNKDANIVFVSNKDELVFRSLEYRPFFFIRKNHLDEELEKQLIALDQVINPRLTFITFQSGSQVFQMPIEHICFVESDRNYLLLYKEHDVPREAVKIRMKISEAESQWKQYGFIRVHRGFLINAHFIDKFTKNEIRMTNGKEIQIGRNYLDNVRLALLEVKIH